MLISPRRLPEAEVRPIRQFTEAEGKIYNRISGLLTATVVLVLVLTALCVMAGMTNAAMERKNDVGLMKAIGGATRRVLRFFSRRPRCLAWLAAWSEPLRASRCRSGWVKPSLASQRGLG